MNDVGRERLAEVAGAVTGALRTVIERCQVSEAEWYGFLDFLTSVGRADEFVLLSDTMGLSGALDPKRWVAGSGRGAR
jgi:hypothetical protein